MMREIRPKKIGFFTDGPAFDGGTIEARALGGSETALIQAARALADMSHEVSVFNNCERPGLFDGVSYHPMDRFARISVSTVFDVFIVSRFHAFFSIPFRAGLKVLWNHDTLDQPDGLRAVLDRIDLLMVLSAFHRDNFLTRIPTLADRIMVTRNGLDLDLIDRATAGTVKDGYKVIYASRPERGLRILLEKIWPALVRVEPRLTLHICGYEVGRTDLAPDLPGLYAYLDELIEKTPGVVLLGALPKNEYYRHLAEASLMLYPCVFPEISCIAALEAQACRTPIITTDGFALSETVRVPEFKIKGRPGTPEYDRAYIDRTLRLLGDPGLAASLAARARQAVEEHYTWPVIVSEWDRGFELNLASRRSRGTGER